MESIEAFAKYELCADELSQLHPEYQYLNLIKQVIERGTLETGRNGNTYSLFGHNMRFLLTNGTVPFLTTKRVAWKTCLKELLWLFAGKRTI